MPKRYRGQGDFYLELDVDLASVIWHERQKDVLISRAAGTRLIGISLLEGSRLTMDVVDGGDVTIEEWP